VVAFLEARRKRKKPNKEPNNCSHKVKTGWGGVLSIKATQQKKSTNGKS